MHEAVNRRRVSNVNIGAITHHLFGENGAPYLVGNDIEVIVHQTVAHTGDLLPWHIGSQRLGIRAGALDSLADGGN